MDQNVRVELVHDPLRHRLLIGQSADRGLLYAVAAAILAEAQERTRAFEGIDDIHAAAEIAEVERLRRVLRIVLPEGDFA
jgi:hypothetical protein